ncbi:MAG TPA: hypothetical protein VI997_07305 [Candidatus Thermoplasmatota archaeon]|nr:hypothetical protein [Candidatus Thermoplasmatota archaeon]
MALPASVFLEGAAAVLALAMAAVVLATGPGRSTNRRLALLLAFEGFAQGLSATGTLADRLGDTTLRAAANGTFIVALIGLTVAYPAFLATLESPLVRPLKRRGVAPALALVGLSLAAWSVADPAPYWLPQGTIVEAGRAFVAVFVLFTIDAAFGLVVAYSSWRRAPQGTLLRRRASAYLAAFGLRDALFATFLVPFFVSLFLGIEPADFGERIRAAPLGGVWMAWLNNVTGVATLCFVALMAYGALRTRLLDLDFRIKVTIRQSTLAAAFIAVFFVVEQLAASFLSTRVGTALGIVAAGALVFALAPLQRIAQRVADAAMPGVKAPGDMTGAERHALYRDQVHTAWADGTLTKDERVLLERLRERLGIASDEANRIEREVVGA